MFVLRIHACTYIYIYIICVGGPFKTQNSAKTHLNDTHTHTYVIIMHTIGWYTACVVTIVVLRIYKEKLNDPSGKIDCLSTLRIAISSVYNNYNNNN